MNCTDGINDVDYVNYDEITVIIDELYTNQYVLYSFVFICILLFPLYCVL